MFSGCTADSPGGFPELPMSVSRREKTASWWTLCTCCSQLVTAQTNTLLLRFKASSEFWKDAEHVARFSCIFIPLMQMKTLGPTRSRHWKIAEVPDGDLNVALGPAKARPSLAAARVNIHRSHHISSYLIISHHISSYLIISPITTQRSLSNLLDSYL